MEHVRTHTRDGGGAYLLLDGSRAMVGNVDMQANQVQFDVGGGVLFKKGETGEFTLQGYGIDAQKFVRFYGTGASPDTVRVHVYYLESKFWQSYSAESYVRCHQATTSRVLLQSYDGAWKTGIRLQNNSVRMSNLPAADPADGTSTLWSNGGVVTVGT